MEAIREYFENNNEVETLKRRIVELELQLSNAQEAHNEQLAHRQVIEERLINHFNACETERANLREQFETEHERLINSQNEIQRLSEEVEMYKSNICLMIDTFRSTKDQRPGYLSAPPDSGDEKHCNTCTCSKASKDASPSKKGYQLLPHDPPQE